MIHPALAPREVEHEIATLRDEVRALARERDEWRREALQHRKDELARWALAVITHRQDDIA